MRWFLHVGDLLDVTADVLLCSANPDLNLSGGVGGAFSLRHGPAMQGWLHQTRREQGRRPMPRGTIVVAPPCGSPYRAVIHAVAVDAAYETSAEVVATLLGRGLAAAADAGARSVAVAALGTGYGRLSMTDFAKALERSVGAKRPPLERAILGVRSPYDAEELLEAVPDLERFGPCA